MHSEQFVPLIDHVIQGEPLSYEVRTFFATKENEKIFLKGMRMCLYAEGYKDPEAQARFDQLSDELRTIRRNSAPQENEKVGNLRGMARFYTAQAIALRKYIAIDGQCKKSDLEIPYSYEVEDVEEFRKCCQVCVARIPCAEYSLVFNELQGLWGGMSPHARRDVRRQIAKEMKEQDDFMFKGMASLMALPPDHEQRVWLRGRIPEYLAEEDKKKFETGNIL